MNNFYEASKVFQEALTQYAWSIFKTYGRELVLRLEILRGYSKYVRG